MSAAARQQRTSGRARQWSTKIKSLGKEAREEARQRRIGQLESDSYVEDAASTARAAPDDDDYVDYGSGEDSDFGEGNTGGGGMKKRKLSGGTSGGGKGGGRTVATAAAKAKRFRTPALKSFQLALDSERYHTYPSFIPTYITIEASPSTFAHPRHFCFVCGNDSTYQCPNCGLRFCKIRCNDEHKESRCLKFLA